MNTTFVEYGKQFIDILVNNLLVPILLIVIPVVLAKVDGYFKRIAKSTEDKNNQEALLSVGKLVTGAIGDIEQIVSGAVASNMSLAEKFKKECGGKLTDEMIDQLKETAFEVAYALLPNNITEGQIFVILGGKEGIRQLMYGFIDKQVILLKENKNTRISNIEDLVAPLGICTGRVDFGCESEDSGSGYGEVCAPDPNVGTCNPGTTEEAVNAEAVGEDPVTEETSGSNESVDDPDDIIEDPDEQ